jgi:AcrR family transcriptional regulator
VEVEDRRARQRETLIEAAERAIAAKGVAGLRARELAAEVGCALGAIYNLVADMDELVLRVGSRTLARLDAALEGAGRAGTPEDVAAAIDRLVAVALAYARFARENLRLWRVLFEYRLADGADVPDWSAAEQIALFRHVLAPLAVLAPDHADEERALLARTLFSAVHGVISIGLDDKLVAVPRAALDGQIETLVRLVCAGLQRR